MRATCAPSSAPSSTTALCYKVFGQAGEGLFPASTVIEAEVRQQYKVELVGRIDSIREHFYAISGDRKLKHPAVVAITEAARLKIFRQSVTT